MRMHCVFQHSLNNFFIGTTAVLSGTALSFQFRTSQIGEIWGASYYEFINFLNTFYFLGTLSQINYAR